MKLFKSANNNITLLRSVYLKKLFPAQCVIQGKKKELLPKFSYIGNLKSLHNIFYFLYFLPFMENKVMYINCCRYSFRPIQFS